MAKRIAALVFIFACTSVAWFILGATIFARSEGQGQVLHGAVASIWGAPQEQKPPTAAYEMTTQQPVTNTMPDGRIVAGMQPVKSTVALPPEATDARVDLGLEHRQNGLLWYSTYKVGFDGSYKFRNSDHESRDVTFALRFPAAKAIYDDFTMTLDDKPLFFREQGDSVAATATIAGGKVAILAIHYKSQGLDSWRYNFGDDISKVRDFRLLVRTNFHDIDFAENTLSPTDKRQTESGWELTWAYNSLLSGFQIGIPMPEKLQPGPLAGQISLFAPVSLFFFFFVMFIITTLRGIELHPMNYFFLAAAFFAFHLLLAYLVDHIALSLAFVICAAVSVLLVISYLRLVIGSRFAFMEAAVAQFIYLVMFSYAFFFKGFTGLSITIGSILTLFVIMQMTGWVRWAEKFA